LKDEPIEDYGIIVTDRSFLLRVVRLEVAIRPRPAGRHSVGYGQRLFHKLGLSTNP
jgi:hypothetical protein